jgi:hypothetical protein
VLESSFIIKLQPSSACVTTVSCGVGEGGYKAVFKPCLDFIRSNPAIATP